MRCHCQVGTVTLQSVCSCVQCDYKGERQGREVPHLPAGRRLGDHVGRDCCHSTMVCGAPHIISSCMVGCKQINAQLPQLCSSFAVGSTLAMRQMGPGLICLVRYSLDGREVPMFCNAVCAKQFRAGINVVQVLISFQYKAQKQEKTAGMC